MVFIGLGISTAARAQDWIHIGPASGEVFFGFDGTWDRPGGGSSREFEFEEGFRLRQQGDILNPGIANFALEIEPSISQRRLHQGGQSSASDSIKVDYSGDFSLLQGTISRFSLDGQTTRARSEADGFLGSRSEFDSTTRRGSLHMRNRAFPITLTYSERELEQTFHPADSPVPEIRRNDVLRSVILKGRSSKLDVQLQRDRFDDRIEGRDTDHVTDTAHMNHRFAWGDNSQLQTRLEYLDRVGFNANKRWSIDESARIQHTDDLVSTASYGFQSFEQQSQTETRDAAYTLTHKLYSNLTTTVGVEAGRLDSDVEVQRDYNGNLDFAYRKNIPGGAFTLNLGGSYGRTDRVSSGGFVGVVDEPHTVPVTGNFLLDQRFIDIATISITDSVGTVFNEGSDYIVASVANDLTEIRIVFGGPIAAGDAVLVSYQYQPLPTLEFATSGLNYNAGLDFGWVSLFHRDSRLNQTLLSDSGSGLLTDSRNIATGLELKWSGATTKATFGAERRFTRTGDFESDSFLFDQTLTRTLSPVARLTLSTSESFTETGDRDIQLYNADASMRWRPAPTLTISPSLGAWQMREDGAVDSDQWFFKAGVDARWALRQLEVDLAYDHNARGGDIANRVEDRVKLNFSRRF